MRDSLPTDEVLESFNPRIRIIGVPAATVPEALIEDLPDHLNWEDNDHTVEMQAPKSPVSVRKIMDVGPEAAVEEDEDEDIPPTEPPAESDPPTTRKPGAIPQSPVDASLAESSFVAWWSDEFSDDRESDIDLPPATSSQGNVVTSAPELDLAALDWDDHETRTDVMAEPEQPPVWGRDEVTMPGSLAHLGPLSNLGPNGTIVHEGPPPESFDDEIPPTQPSSPPPAMPSAPRSIEIDLADLEASNSLVSFLEDAYEHTPPPKATRLPSAPPSSIPPTLPPKSESESFPPVEVAAEEAAVSEPHTRQSIAHRPRRTGLYALGAMLTVCLGVIAFLLYPKTGGVEVHLSTPEGAVAKAEIFVDGQKRCDTDPCILTGIAPGKHTVKVVAPGRDQPVLTTVVVKANKKSRVSIALPALPVAEEPAPAAPAEPRVETKEPKPEKKPSKKARARAAAEEPVPAATAAPTATPTATTQAAPPVEPAPAATVVPVAPPPVQVDTDDDIYE